MVVIKPWFTTVSSIRVDDLRSAIDTFADSDPLVVTVDSKNYAQHLLGDNIHFSSEGVLGIGREAADAFKTLQ